MLRRLTRTQFRNALNDVFGYTVDINTLDTDSWDSNMATIGAAVVVTSDQGAEQYNTAVENAVNVVFSDSTKRSQFIGCTPTGQSTDTCLRGYIQKLGLRAWRRPLASAELDQFGTLAASATTTLGSAVEGARWATVALFESPNFLYRPELGAPAANGAMRFSGYEMAGRLSFLIWNSLPDQTLMDDAGSGMLSTTDGIRAEATRMLGIAAGRESVGNFAEEYLRLDRIATQPKDPSFPDYTPSLQTAMVRDVRDTWASRGVRRSNQRHGPVHHDEGRRELGSRRSSTASTPPGLTPTTFQTKSLPADGTRAGLLSKAGLLSEFANQQFGSPTLRGKFMRESLMCLTVPPPPKGVNQGAVDQPTDVPMTRRQRLEQHRKDPVVRRVSRPDGSAGPAARELRRDRKVSDDRQRPAGRSERRVRRAGCRRLDGPWAPSSARAPPSRSAWCAGTTRTRSATPSETSTAACSTPWRRRSRRPASRCAT